MEYFFDWYVVVFWPWYIIPSIILVAAVVLVFFRKRSERIRKTKNLLFIIALICFLLASFLTINNMLNAIVPTINNNHPPTQDISEGGNSPDTDGADSQDDDDSSNDIPGNISKDRVIDSVADWAKYKDGILRADTQTNLDKWFSSSEVEKYRSITLEDGTIIGYANLIEGNDIEKEENLTQIVSEIAKSMELESHTVHVFFIISDSGNLENYIGFLTSSREGYTADIYLQGIIVEQQRNDEN